MLANMFQSRSAPRNFLILGVCLALAVLLGYLLATPFAFKTLAMLALVGSVLSFPLIMRWHQILLIFSWNATITFFFLPGQPSLWMIMTLAVMFCVLLDYSVNKRKCFIRAPAVTRPLVFLAVVVIATAQFTGGIGIRSFGSSSYGGKRYFLLLVAILGYFALTSQAIPRERAMSMASGYFLSGMTAIISNLAYLAGPGFSFIYYFVPPDATFTGMQLGSDYLVRLSGVTWASIFFCFFLLMKFGIRDILDWTRPWRLFVFLLAMATSTLGGFRSALLVLVFICVAQFFLEGLFRTRLFPALILSCVLAAAVIFPFADKLPLSVQRSLSFLPVEIDPLARRDAQISLDWRLYMWKALLREVPQYLFPGKGYAMSPSDLYLFEEGVRRGIYDSFEPAMASGNYHSGPLTVLIPFGIPGAVAFLWFSGAALWVLYQNYRFGAASLKNINTFLLSYFGVRLFSYLVLYGDFATELFTFTGALGLNVALNGGVRKPSDSLTDMDLAPEVALARDSSS